MSANSNNGNKNDSKKTDDRNLYHPNNIHSSAMTPSIITTINNANPATPPTISNNCNSNNNNNPIYESYIEDSFVGHWEREDDDPEDLYRGNNGERDDGEPTDEEDSALHPSTIEFDFDSFGPESFIYAPSAAVGQVTIQQQPPPTTTKTDDTVTSEATNQDNIEQKTIEPDNIINVVKTDIVEKREEIPEDKQQAEELSVDNLMNKNYSQRPQQQQQQQPAPKVAQREPQARSGSPSSYHLVETAQIDLRVIEPYKKVISHAGYCHHLDPTVPAPKPGEPAPAIIVFSACYLPDRSRRDYNYVMDQLFLYVLSSLHELIADDYILVYLHNTQPSATSSSTSARASTSNISVNGSSNNIQTGSNNTTNQDPQYQNNLPTFTWIKRCYQMIDRKLRKNLKILYLVKPTFWLKTIVIMCKPFISTKFSKKLRFVEDMEGLKKCLPVDKLILPASAENI